MGFLDEKYFYPIVYPYILKRETNWRIYLVVLLATRWK